MTQTRTVMLTHHCNGYERTYSLPPVVYKMMTNERGEVSVTQPIRCPACSLFGFWKDDIWEDRSIQR